MEDEETDIKQNDSKRAIAMNNSAIETKSATAQAIEFIENDLGVVYESRLEMMEGAHFDTYTIKQLAECGRTKIAAANKIASYLTGDFDDSLIDVEDLLEVYHFKGMHNETDGGKVSCFINERVLNDVTIKDSDKLAFIVLELDPHFDLPEDEDE